MATRKVTKRALFLSFVSMFLCFTMLIGTTYAWFTDSVSSATNIITAGNLDVELYHANEGTNDADEKVTSTTTLFTDVDSAKWEPGAMAWEKFTVKNVGTLALKYEFALNVTSASVVDGISFAKMLKVAVVDESFDYTRENVNNIPATEWKDLDSFEVIASAPEGLENNESKTFGVIIWWQPSEKDNLFNMNNGKQVGSIGVDVGVVLNASQFTFEEDSFGIDYDTTATFPMAKINFTSEEDVTDKIDQTSGALTENVTVGDDRNDIQAEVPAGVTMAEGADKLELTVKTIEESSANIVIDEENQSTVSVDVHIEGVAEDNTVPMKIVMKGFMKPGLNDNNYALYHVENGVTNAMTLVPYSELDAHNEFSYNAVTGDVTLCLASFSEVAAVADEVVHWDGKSATAFATYENGTYGTGSAEKPHLIANASQLAYFRDLVDGGRTFEGEYVKLANDIILNHHGETRNQFDPIGWGYANSAYNAGGAAGKVFMGTFDGGEYDASGKLVGRHGIHGLWQNGWDLEAKTKTDYTYTNCGFGLFASVKDATIKNLEIKHANVVVECVEAGIVVGLAQGNCTFENLYVYSSHIANYQRPAGGVVGEVSPRFENGVAQESTVTFNNVHVGSSCTVGSLWGDFDTPCGGVIGAYWDDAGKTTVNMNSVDVSCVLDVYSDVTSAYQWYAYRRAGMLIGNTDQPPADGKNAKVATANFLNCTNCVVIYDYWADYKYCQFTNNNNPGKNYPWVRIQASQYNGAYSNPRYGHPKDLHDHLVTSDNHEHQEGDKCHEYIPFNQLYGGGQGVYGQTGHPGVTIGKYTIVYMVGDEIQDVHYVANNSVPYTALLPLEAGYEWVDIDSNKVTQIPAGNTSHIVLYRNTTDKNMVRFVDKDGYVITEQEFAYGKDASYYQTNITPPSVPPVEGYYGVWPEWWKMLAAVTKDGEDVTVHAVYTVIYEEDNEAVTPDKEIVIFDENGDTGDLFQMISQGKSVVMYKDLAGNIGSASIKTFATVGDPNTNGWVSNHARLDLDSFELVYDNDSNAAQNWTLFTIKEGASLTVGGGVHGGGKLSFVFNTLNKNSAPRLFNLEYVEGNVDNGGHEIHSTLILERGVVIEMKFHKNIFNKNSNFSISEENIKTLITGHSHPDGTEEQHHPGIQVEISEEGDYKVIRLIVNSYTTFVGNTAN